MTSTEIKVLTYNVCWEAMAMNSKKYDKECNKNAIDSTNKCKTNVLAILTQDKYDIILLQEASNFDTHDITDMTRIHFKSGKEHQVVYYKTSVFTKKSHSTGDFDTGRPYTILLLEHISSKKEILVINVHLPHKKTEQEVITLLDKISNNTESGITTALAKNDMHYIIGGDFNVNLTKGLYKILNRDFIPCNTQINTCCDEDLSGTGHTDKFDNILLSNATCNNVKIADGNGDKKNTSDHLPLKCIVQLGGAPETAKVPPEAAAVNPAKAAAANAAKAAKAAKAAPNNSITEYQKDTVTIYGKWYYLGDKLKSKDINSVMSKKLKHPHNVLEPKEHSIYTKDDFIKEYTHNTDIIEDLIKICKAYLQIDKTHIKDAIGNDSKPILVKNENDKAVLTYILETRKSQLEKEKKYAIISLHGLSYLLQHNSIIKRIQVNPTTKSVVVGNGLIDFLLFYVWSVLHKPTTKPSNAKTSWNTANPKKTWDAMLLEINKKNIKDVISAINSITTTDETLQGLTNAFAEQPALSKKQVVEHLENLLTIIKGFYIATEESEAESEAESGAKSGEDANIMDIIATIVGKAFKEYLLKEPELRSTSRLEYLSSNDVEINAANEEALALGRMENPFQGGGSLLPPSFLLGALQPIMHYLHTNHSIYSLITDIPCTFSYDLIRYMQQLHHICSSITNEKQYGFYRIKHIPSELFTHVQQLIDCTDTYASHNGTHYSASRCNTDGDYLYFLCVDGNIAFTEDVTGKKQLKEQNAVRTFFQEKMLYLLYSPKKEVRMSNYMQDPYYVYDVNYEDMDHHTHQIRIRNIDTLLNTQDVPLDNYLTVESKKLVDICQLELSLIHQLNHLIV
jgi:endonuclease/exonuclease/phosphatase family metal-dependent hydrolase